MKAADSKGMSRRAFLTGVGIVGAGAAAIGASACAPRVVNSSSTSDSGDGSSDWLGSAPGVSSASETVDADVVIVGLGCAGVPAARAAAEAGAKVVCIEASSQMNSAASDMAIIGGKTMATWGRGDGFLDKDDLIQMHMEEESHHCNQEIITRYCDESGAALDWFIEPSDDLYICKETFEDVPKKNRKNFLFPYFYPMLSTYHFKEERLPCYPTSVGFSSLPTVMAANLKVATDAGAEVRYDTKAVELITDDSGAVTGVYAQPVDGGDYIQVNAKAVVLCTGDYLMNDEMMTHFQPECDENGIQRLSVDVDKNGNYTNVGDGQKMACWAGAHIEQWHAPMIHHMGGGAGSDGRGVIGNNGFLWLDVNGKRFMNEDVPGQQLENQVERAPQHKAYQFFDSNWPKQLKWFPAAHGTACIYRKSVPSWYASGQIINIRTPKDISSAVKDGRCYKADTIDALLDKIDIDKDEAKKSIKRYNKLAKAGKDTDFYKSSKRLFALEKGPFYVAECGVALTLANLGGVDSDGDCHVYKEDGTRIQGLYVAGAPQGGRFNVQYPISMKGLSAGMCMVFGKIAGENAAKGA